jgi:DNA modification methylase
MEIKRMAISDIRKAKYNPRKELQPGDPAYEKLNICMNEFGLVEPLVYNKRTRNLVGGHQRLSVLIAQGATDVYVSVVDLSRKKEKLLNLALNKVVGEWDEEKLARLLDEIVRTPELNIEASGFGVIEAEELIARVLPECSGEKDDAFDIDAALDLNRPAVTQPGQLIELGRHRLLCGDSTNPEHVTLVMNGDRAILFATDPPYLVGYTGANHPGKRGAKKDKNKNWSGSYGITWDDAEANPDLYDKFCKAAIDVAIEPRAAWYCFHASRRQAMVEAVWNKYGAFVHQQIVWVKDRPILTRSWYTWQHEPLFFGWIKGQKPPRRAKDYPSTTWQIPTVQIGKVTEHPTSKPVEVFAIPMRQHTRRGEICYEPFCGSGSQLIAAEKLGRRCFAIEISPHYCDVIIRRWIDYVGVSIAPADLATRYALPKKEAA